MPILGIQTADKALKSYFLPSLRYQLNSGASAALAQFERDSESVVGKDIVMALRYGRSGGSGAGTDIGDLPEPNSRKTKQAKWETKNLYARIMISDKTIEASRSSVGAFANLLKQELEDALEDAKDNLSRQVFGDGTGKLANITAVSGNVLTVDNVDYFAEGMLIDILSSGGVVRNTTYVEVVAVDKDAGTITVNAVPTGTVADDFITVQKSYMNEITGLKAVFDATTLYGIDRTTNKWLYPKKIAVNGELSETAIQQGIDWAEKEARSQTNFLLCSYGVRRAYQYLMQSQKRQVNTLELRGGWRALEYAGGNKPIGLVADKYCPAGTLYGLDTNDWKMYEMNDWTWMDRDGSVLHRVSGKAAYEATLVRYCDLGCQKPRGQFVLTGITEH